jgi:hypothetical protein
VTTSLAVSEQQHTGLESARPPSSTGSYGERLKTVTFNDLRLGLERPSSSDSNASQNSVGFASQVGDDGGVRLPTPTISQRRDIDRRFDFDTITPPRNRPQHSYGETVPTSATERTAYDRSNSFGST